MKITEDKIKTGKSKILMGNLMRGKILLFLIFLFSSGLLSAQEVSFVASAPATVVKGEQFRLTYTLRNGQGSDGKFPTDIKGLEILIGPSVSQSHRTQIINGKASSESSESYTFILMANTEGSFTIPAATIKVDGKTYTSNSLNVKVLPADKNAPSQQGRGGQASRPASTGGNISATDVFIRPIVTKTKVYEQEAFLITFRFYTVFDVRDIGKIEFPEFEGFIVEDFPIANNVQLRLEHYNGRNYFVADLKKSLLFPQRSGKINIPSGKLEMVFSVPSGRRVQTWHGPRDIPVDVKKVLTTNAITIDVQSLPDGKPDNFSNAVGTFTMASEISETKIKANDAVTIKLDITGNGNFKLIKNPEIKLPTDFETYDPKTSNNFRVTENGLSGTKSLEYLFIPRHQGDYVIPPVEFSYFDLKTKTYKTLTTPEYKLEVEKDPNAGSGQAVSYTNQNEIETVKDILFLKTKGFNFVRDDKYLIGSFGYWLWYIIPLLLFTGGIIWYRNQIKQNANIALMKNRKANKVAAKRLKMADAYLKSNDKEKFYEEVLRATWGYLSDKLLIPVADLNRENIEHELAKYGTPQSLINTFIHILDTCEFARYAPATSGEAMGDTYTETVNAISEMENIIKKKK